jgi:hypothetical protein
VLLLLCQFVVHGSISEAAASLRCLRSRISLTVSPFNSSIVNEILSA